MFIICIFLLFWFDWGKRVRHRTVCFLFLEQHWKQQSKKKQPTFEICIYATIFKYSTCACVCVWHILNKKWNGTKKNVLTKNPQICDNYYYYYLVFLSPHSYAFIILPLRSLCACERVSLYKCLCVCVCVCVITKHAEKRLEKNILKCIARMWEEKRRKCKTNEGFW